MPLPLFPIGTQPMQSNIATASQKKGGAYFVLLILILLQIQGEDDNSCNSFLMIALDMIVLLGLQTLIVAVPDSRPCDNQPPANNRPPCNSPNPTKQSGFTICSVDADVLGDAAAGLQEPEEQAQTADAQVSGTSGLCACSDTPEPSSASSEQ